MLHRANRFELKYVVDALRAKAFMSDLLPFVKPDPHGSGEGFYRVTSLYYDSPDFRFYREKIDGLRNRRKLRIRIYPWPGLPDSGRAWVEIKRRTDRTVQKTRLEMDLESARALCAGELDPDALEAGERAAAWEVRSLVEAFRLGPACVISYLRRAFVGGEYDEGLRVTFDTDLTARAHALDVEAGLRGRRFLHPSSCILEVKIDDKAPRWIANLLAAHDFSMMRISKYCLGLERSRAGFREFAGYYPAPGRGDSG